MSSFLLDVDNLSVALTQGSDRKYAVEGVSLQVKRGEVVCVVGESGSGKSVLAYTIMGLLPKSLRQASGKLSFEQINLSALSESGYRALRGNKIGMIFQEPMAALNPVLQVGDQIEETLIAHGNHDSQSRKARVRELLRAIGLPDPDMISQRYPHQLSGGQRQRIVIAIALANEPALLIADEPTTALDVTTQAEVLKLISDVRQKMNLGVLFITHDFGIVAEIADRIVVMQHGRIVETGQAEDILQRPSHPYTKELIQAVPRLQAAQTNNVPADASILQVRGLHKTYGSKRSLFSQPRAAVAALQDVSFNIKEGETVALVGESGSGKTTLGQCIVQLASWDKGSIEYAGQQLLSAHHGPRRADIQMVFQDPFGSLNPRHRIRRIITEPAIVNGVPRDEAERRMQWLLERVGLGLHAADRYPHAFSGGQRQRIGIARALVLQPRLLIADEPVSALDVSVQAKVLELLAGIRRDLGLSLLFITHDLRVAATVADRILVMCQGRIVESGPTAQVLQNPQSDYARALLNAIPGLKWEAARQAAHCQVTETQQSPISSAVQSEQSPKSPLTTIQEGF